MRRWPPIALVASFLLAATSPGANPVGEQRGIISRIKRIPIQSTALATVGYSKRLRALEIEFRNGAIYRYFDVGPEVCEALLKANSKARFYDQNVRHKYRSLHVRPRAR